MDLEITGGYDSDQGGDIHTQRHWPDCQPKQSSDSSLQLEKRIQGGGCCADEVKDIHIWRHWPYCEATQSGDSSLQLEQSVQGDGCGADGANYIHIQRHWPDCEAKQSGDSSLQLEQRIQGGGCRAYEPGDVVRHSAPDDHDPVPVGDGDPGDQLQVEKRRVILSLKINGRNTKKLGIVIIYVSNFSSI